MLARCVATLKPPPELTLKQGKRLEALEGRDGEKWRKVMGYIATAIVGIVLGYLFKRIGM